MRVEVSDGCLLIDGKEKRPLYSAEFHYWRNEPRYWPKIMDRIADAGFTVVCSFVQPNVHEIAPAEFDFMGRTNPARDIPRFLELAKERGLLAHLRIGPACCEWRVSGGTSFGTPWKTILDAFAEAVVPHQVTRGGSLALLQVHNEWFDVMANYRWLKPAVEGFDGFHAPPCHYWLELIGPHSHYHTAGYEFEFRHFAAHLREKYGEIGDLNRAWASDYSRFEQAAEELEQLSGGTVHGLMSYIDSCLRPGSDHSSVSPQRSSNLTRLFDISNWLKLYMAYALCEDVDHVRAVGFDIPITHNWPMIREDVFNRKAHLDLSGYDSYAPVDVDLWQWTLMTTDMQNNRLPFSGEFECGTINPYMWGGLGLYDEAFARLSLLSFFANGMKGVNLYMFVERDNWCHCPVDERGGIRPTYGALRRVIETLKDVRWHELRPLWDLAVVKNTQYEHWQSGAPCVFSQSGLDLPWLGPLVYSGWDPKAEFHTLYRGLQDANVDFKTIIAEDDVPGLDQAKGAIAFALPMMPRASAEGLLRWVESGGRLLVYPSIPDRDVDGSEYGFFRSALKVADMRDSTLSGLRLPDGRRVEFEKPIRATELETDGDAFDAIRSDSGAVIGYSLSVGEGRLAVLGLNPAAHRDLLEFVALETLACKRYAWTEVPMANATVALDATGDPVVIVCNGSSEKTVERVTLDSSLIANARESVVFDLTSGSEPSTVRVSERGVVLPVTVPKRDAAVLHVEAGRPVCVVANPRADKDLSALRWETRTEPFSSYIEKYAAAEYGEGWVRVPVAEWTLPAIAAGSTYGVQGWLWLRTEVPVPNADGPFHLRVRPLGWHDRHVVYMNGQEAGQVLVERPGAGAMLNISRQIRPGELNTIAIRTYRQTLDCHDLGRCGFQTLRLEGPDWLEDISEMMLAQERLDIGEQDGWMDSADGWLAASFPFHARTLRNEDLVWLRTEFDVHELPSAPALRLSGENALITIFLNGEYVSETPYLPVEMPLEGLREGRNRLALRMLPSEGRDFWVKRDDRFTHWIENTFACVDVRLDGVAIAGGA